MGKSIQLKINNWDKHNTKSDEIRYPHFLKVLNPIPNSDSLFFLTTSQKWGWICVLCERSSQKKEIITINVDYFCHISGLNETDFLRLLEIMSENKTIDIIKKTSVRNLSETCQKPVRNLSNTRIDKTRQEQTRSDESKSFDFEKSYSFFPRKEGKTMGVKKCEKEIKNDEDYENLTLAIKNYSNLVKQEKRDKKFILQFSTFMNSWKDWINPDPSIYKNKITPIFEFKDELMEKLKERNSQQV